MNQWISLYRFPHENVCYVETSTSDLLAGTRIDTVCPREHCGPDPVSRRTKDHGLSRDAIELTERNAWIRSVLIAAKGRSLTTIMWWSSCIASIMWWKRDFFVASGVVPYWEGEFDVAELSFSVTRWSREIQIEIDTKDDSYIRLLVVDGILVYQRFENFALNCSIYVAIDCCSVLLVHYSMEIIPCSSNLMCSRSM